MGKKKGKKKSSSKSKKGTIPKTSAEETPASTIPSNQEVDGENDVPPATDSGKDTDGSNETVTATESSVNDDAPADAVDTSSELGFASAAEIEDATANAESPAIDEKISAGDDEKADNDIAEDNHTADAPTSLVEELSTKDPEPPCAESLETEDAKADAPTDKQDGDEAMTNGNDATSNSEDANGIPASSIEEPVTLIADSVQYEVEQDALPEQKDSDELIVQDQAEINGTVSNGDSETVDEAIFLDARSFETDDSKDEVPPVEIIGKKDAETNLESNTGTNAETTVEATNGDDSKDSNKNIDQTEAEPSTEKINLTEKDDQINTENEPEANTDPKVEVIKIFDPNADGQVALDLRDGSYRKRNVMDEGETYNDNDDETNTTYVDDLPLFHYSRIVGSGLPRGITSTPSSVEKQSTCSEFAVVRVDREELVSSVSNAPPVSPSTSELSRTTSANSDALSTAPVSSVAAIRKRQREQALLLSSDLWFQPHSIVASGYGNGSITLTRLTEGQDNGAGSSPSVVFATASAELGGIIDTSGHGKSNGNKSYTTELHLREGGSPYSDGASIVDMSFDASGSVLGAIDAGGHCCMWEFKYTTSLQSTSRVFGNPTQASEEKNAATNTGNFFTPASTPNPARPQVSAASSEAAKPAPSMFSNFMSALTGIPPADEQYGGNRSSHGSTSNANGNNIINNNSIETNNSTSPNRAGAHPEINNINSQPSLPEAQIPALTAEISNQSRINYPARWGPPTCLAIDPAYTIKRDKSIVTGFANGQLYLTKKGTFFQRRNDTILYQAGNTGGESYRGIETVVWRGPLVAFADATGIKLIDSDHMTRIAHINRPAGASPFLYPSLRDLSPSLVFETSQHLLVGWGDCLMQIYVEEKEEDASSSTLSTAQSRGSTEASRERKIRRTAACTMAWELDCVACDIVPLDSDHVVVLGLVSVADDAEDGYKNNASGLDHDLEMQILSRGDGTISYSDSLPLIEESRGQIQSMLSVRDFRLLSSFALPRMEDADETKALRALKGANDMGFIGIDVSFDMNQPLFAGTDSFAKQGIEFRDPHMEWSIKSIMYDEDVDDQAEFGSSEEEDSSVDSDDYECILRPIETIRPLSSKSTGNTDHSALPPTMVVCTKSEAILSLTSTVDDAVQYSLENHRCALALSRGLRHKRQLRRYTLDDLINYYLEAVLRIPAKTTEPESLPSLSLRRMQLAVKAMPVLLGDRIELWERWTKELENIPGSLFLLRKYLPVRDPVLPSTIYIRILEKMLAEVEHLSQSSKRENSSSIEIHDQASKHFLESLIAWGPTKVLKEYISFYKYNKQRRKGEKDLDGDIRSTEISLQRRYLQTAAGYLIFPVRDIEEELKVSAPRYEVLNVDTEDSLFDIEKAVALVAPFVPIVASPGDLGGNGAQEAEAANALAPNNHTCLEAMARLRMMQGEFDLALKCFLAIGACHATEPIESFEESAIRFVNGTNSETENSPAMIGESSYEFVMSLIERHELNQFLFEKDFLMSSDSKVFMPIFALIRLIGLRRVGNFLMEHCVAAGFTYNTTLSEMNAFSFSEEDSLDEPKGILRRGSLPIDKVAEQLESSPAILHWYLHLVFTRRPDFYVNFPTNSIPSKAVTSLHRRHFQLYVDLAGETRDSSKVLAGIEAYKVESKTTPLLTFLKAALPLAGVMPLDARRVLEIERRKDAEAEDDDSGGDSTAISSSPTFALELAYIIEQYSDETETEAMGILNLYLKGAKSLTLAVSYAQRQKKFTALLWDHLISHCLQQASDGTIYGELLEAAALKGADLSRLVERIPPGMVVEGLKPKLVAAVADYRMKLEIYEAAIAAGSEEKITLMREIGHRVRRGLRYDVGKYRKKSFAELIAEKVQRDEREAPKGATSGSGEDEADGKPQPLSKTRLRRSHKRLVYTIPRR